MNCWFCGYPLIWQNDFSTEDYGYEQDGIVAVLSCSNCNTMVEAVNFFEGEVECGESKS